MVKEDDETSAAAAAAPDADELVNEDRRTDFDFFLAGVVPPPEVMEVDEFEATEAAADKSVF